MKPLLARFKYIFSVQLLALSFASCSLNASHTPAKEIPIAWHPGFTMQELLASPGNPIVHPSELPHLITASWYAEINVTATKTGETTFASCKDYFEKAGKLTRTIKDNEMSAYIEFAIMCDATKLFLEAESSETTFLPDDILNANTPKIWPKKIAFQISPDESRRKSLNPKLTTWADITPLLKYEKKSETKSIYYLTGGYQEIDIIGRGDSNNDGVEDIFVISRDYVEGGNYFNMRLFVLSVSEKGNWDLISSI
ncbi:MAG: hypothetical protein K6L80_06660 [Agarilytica sp.]